MPLHGWEILLVLIIILIIFGPGKLPQVFGALGKGIREFRKGKTEEIDSHAELEEPEEPEEKKQD